MFAEARFLTANICELDQALVARHHLHYQRSHSDEYPCALSWNP